MQTKKAIAALTLSLSLFSLTGCSTHTHYNSAQQDQKLEQVHNQALVNVPFAIPQSASSKVPMSYTQNVSSLEDEVQGSVLVLSKDKKQLMRTDNGVTVWSSAEQSQPITQARFVRDGQSLWVVAVVGNTLQVYGGYRSGQNIQPDRLQQIGSGSQAYLGNTTVYYGKPDSLSRYYPSTGFVAGVDLPHGYKVLETTPSGLLLQKGQDITLAGDGNTWTITPQKGQNNSIIGLSSALIALYQQNADKSQTITVYSLVDGSQIASMPVTQKPSGLDEKTNIITAAQQNYYAFGNYLINTQEKTISDESKPISDVFEDILYFQDGSAYDLLGKRDVWANNVAPVSTIINGDAFIIANNGLYVFDLQ